MEWFTEPFALAFQQRALLGGVLAALMTSVVGTWLVLRGMSFFGDAFVHGIVPGIAAAVVIDINPLIGAAVAAAIMIGAIELAADKTTKERFAPIVKETLRRVCQERGLIIRATGATDALCFSPPLIISEAEVDEMFDIFAGALDDLALRVARENLRAA